MPKRVEAPGESDRLDPSIWKIGSVAVLGSFLAQLDVTVVNVSLSSLAVTLHSNLSAIQWVTSGYLLALALMLPLSGWMVDRIGAKALYLWCFSAFTLSSALCGFFWSAHSLIGFRLLQGMSAGPPMATTTLNVVMRIGGPTLTTICATFLGWRLKSADSHDGMLSAFSAAFILLCTFHGLLIGAALRLPGSPGGGRHHDGVRHAPASKPSAEPEPNAQLAPQPAPEAKPEAVRAAADVHESLDSPALPNLR